jgi:Protein of unknown function (DUF2911)
MKSTFHVVRILFFTGAFLALVACSKKEKSQANDGESDQAATTETPAASDRGTASVTFGSDTVSINYGRPQLKGRDMLAEAYDGIVWRMGMNEATEIKTDADLKFGETAIPKGSYSLWMKKVAANQWELVFNKKTGIWGTEHSAPDDFANVPMTMSKNPESVESFTVELAAKDENSGTLKAIWGTAILSTDFTVSAGTM